MGRIAILLSFLLLTACDRYAPVDNPDMSTGSPSNSDTTYTNSTSQPFTNSTSHQTFDNSTSHQTFGNSTSTFTNSTTIPGTIIKTIPYPSGIVGISDLVCSNTSLWLLAERGSTSGSTLELIQVDKENGQTLQTIPLVNLPFSLNHASEMAWDGEFFWMTSYGWSNGVPQSYVFKVDLSGNLVTTIPCPATNTGGFCEGLAWDGTYLWSGASDNKNIVQFSIDGTVQKTITPFNTVGIGDIAYNNGKLIISNNNNVYQLDLQNNTTTNQFYTGYTKKGDWDGQLFWFINSSTQEIEGTYIW